MTEYELKVPGRLLSRLLGEKDAIAGLLEEVLNQVLEAQATEQIGAGRYERAEGRTAYRNGYRSRQLYTRVGRLTLRVPQLRDGSFSKSTVSQLCTGLDARVRAFNERKLGTFPFVLVDAMYLKARDGEAVASKAALIVSGVNNEGHREVLGVRIGDSESEAFWLETFRWLKGRGLADVTYVVSDDHNGLVSAARRSFQGAIWQRCQVHFMRNVLSYTPARHKATVGEGLKRILRAETAAEARERCAEFAEAMETTTPKAIACLEAGIEDALAVMALPAKYRRRMKSTNMQERLIQEVRRRERVIRIFPNEDAALRLVGALLAEINEEWQERRYLDMGEFHEWLAERQTYEAQDNVTDVN